MKQIFTFLIIGAFLACNKQNVPIKDNIINLEGAMNSVETIQLSEITSDITYIPLETTDSSLIGEQADMRVFNDYILVSSANQSLKLFDRITGKFLSTIGHIGIDPQGYAKDAWGKVNYWIDSQKNLIYVLGWKNDWQVYDVGNKYVNRIIVSDDLHCNLAQACFLITADTIYGQNKLCIDHSAPTLFTYNYKSESLEIIPDLKEDVLPLDELLSISNLLGNYVSYGGDLQMAIFSGDRKFYMAINSPSLWKYQQEIRVKQAFNDTIYTIEKNRLQPSWIFNLGNWHWDYQDRLNVAGCENKISIDYVLENENLLYFHFHTGFYSENQKAYCGIYQKKTGEVKVMDSDQWIDAKFNQPLQIRNVSNNGKFCALLLPEKLSDELKEHLQVEEDDNPIIVML